MTKRRERLVEWAENFTRGPMVSAHAQDLMEFLKATRIPPEIKEAIDRLKPVFANRTIAFAKIAGVADDMVTVARFFVTIADEFE